MTSEATASSIVRPALSIDTNSAIDQGRHPRQANRAVVHAARSAQAPLEGDDAAQSSTSVPGQQTHPRDYNDYETYAPQGRGSNEERYGNSYTHSNDIDASGQHSYQSGFEGEHGDDVMAEDDIHGEHLDDEEGDEEDEEELEDDEDDDLSSSPSIPDENIDFDLVYALHTFVATVEGQATVNKGNSLTLLDDSNSYW